MVPFLIVIPTYKRSDLLDRTLQSLVACQLPPSLEKVIVAENGIKSGADSIVKKYADLIPVIYKFSEKPNKSNALNEILKNTTNEFMIFFDDDVRVHRDTLLNYSKEVGDINRGFFFCGRVRIDYEEKPPEWILDYFPPSVKGWHFADEKCKLEVPYGLGANWGGFAIDLREAGGFDERRGPGSSSRGQETAMMEKLLKRNVMGFYLPDCEVWHFVPKNNCSPEWVLSRARQKSVGHGIELAQADFSVRIKNVFNSNIKLWGICVLLDLLGNRIDFSNKFYYEYRKNCHSGILKGLKIAKSDQSIVPES